MKVLNNMNMKTQRYATYLRLQKFKKRSRFEDQELKNGKPKALKE